MGAAWTLRSKFENERVPESFPTSIVIQDGEDAEEGRARAIVVDDDKDASDVSAGVDDTGEKDAVDLFASESADE